MFNSKYHLLIVDDDSIARELLKQMLSELPLKISEFNNAIDALDFLEKNTVDVVVTDIMMPVMDGLALTEKIKASPRLEHTPVVVITSLIEPQAIAKAFNKGATDYISKPLQRYEVLARVKNILHRKLAEDKLVESKALISQQNEQLQHTNIQLNSMIVELQAELSVTKEKVNELIKEWSEASSKSSDVVMSNAALLQQVSDLMHRISQLKSKNVELKAILKDSQRSFDLL